MNGVGGSQPAKTDKCTGDATDLTAGVTDLYVSTFQALALVLDAKYRLTNGRVRRVQHNTVRLAGEMGIVDPALLKAIDAATLLHDPESLGFPTTCGAVPGEHRSTRHKRQPRYDR